MLIGNVPVRLIANGIGRAVDFGPPTTIEYQFRNIPLELRALPRWMPFRFVSPSDRYGAGRPAKGVRWSKLPVNVHTGGPGSPTDPRTWADYDTAYLYYLDHRDDEDPFTVAHGIGLVIGEGLAFLDLDGCIVDGQINEFAKKLIAEFETYWEISASGKGVHGIARASLPPEHPRRLGPGLELYTRSRFCIFTDAVLEARTRVGDCQSAMDGLLVGTGAPSGRQHNSAYIHSGGIRENTIGWRAGESTPSRYSRKEFSVRARMRADWKATALMAGDLLGYPSPSEADAALVEKHLYYSDYDFGLTDRIFRSSGLYRQKWDERRGESTYGERTIEEVAQWMRTHNIERRPRERKRQRRGRPLSNNLLATIELLRENTELKPAELALKLGVRRDYAQELSRRARRRLGPPTDVNLNATCPTEVSQDQAAEPKPPTARVPAPEFEEFVEATRQGPYRPARRSLQMAFQNIRRYAEHRGFRLELKHLSDWWAEMLHQRSHWASGSDERAKRLRRQSMAIFLESALRAIDGEAGRSSFHAFRLSTRSYYRGQDLYPPPSSAILTMYLDCGAAYRTHVSEFSSSAARVYQRLSRRARPPLRLAALKERIVAACCNFSDAAVC